MHTRPSRSRANNLGRFLPLLLGAVAGAAGCADDGWTTWIDDPALRGATAGEVEALVADLPNGKSERQYFLNIGAARLRLRFMSVAPMLTSGDRIGVWGDRLSDDFLVSRHIIMPPAADDTAVTSALIGAPVKP